MQSNKDLINAAYRSMEAKDMKTLGTYFADDFKFTGATPEPMNRQQFIDLMQALTTAMPDWKFNESDISETGDTVRMTLRITGKNTGIVNLPQLGISSAPATGKKVALPPEKIEVVIKNGKIASFNVTSPRGGGVPGIMTQLGIKMPVSTGAR